MKTHLHTPSNLYAYINKVRQNANMAAEIAKKEEELDLLTEAIDKYEEAGFTAVTELLSKTYNEKYKDLLLLKLNANELENEILTFELAAFLED